MKYGVSDRTKKIFDHLFGVAEKSEPVAAARVASALVYKNDIVYTGVNLAKSDPFQKIHGKNPNSIYLHSETRVIKQSIKLLTPKELKKSTLYVCRVKYTDRTKHTCVQGLSKPCPGCESAIKKYGIRTVIYTLDDFGYGIWE